MAMNSPGNFRGHSRASYRAFVDERILHGNFQIAEQKTIPSIASPENFTREKFVGIVYTKVGPSDFRIMMNRHCLYFVSIHIFP